LGHVASRRQDARGTSPDVGAGAVKPAQAGSDLVARESNAECLLDGSDVCRRTTIAVQQALPEGHAVGVDEAGRREERRDRYPCDRSLA
jgi:hypothetical protein